MLPQDCRTNVCYDKQVKSYVGEAAGWGCWDWLKGLGSLGGSKELRIVGKGAVMYMFYGLNSQQFLYNYKPVILNSIKFTSFFKS